MSVYARSLIEFAKKERKSRNRRVILFCLITIFIIYRTVLSMILISSNIEITSHRGSTNLAPENTMASIIEAITLDVDYIEINVQLSKDEQIILLHDSTFKRTAGIPIAPYMLTYEEIKEINAGNYKFDTFKFDVPLLEDVMKICQYSCKLNIELKDYGHNQNLATKVVELIEENDFANNCVITSKSTRLLKQVRNLNPNIKIGLITSSASLSTYIQNSFVDFYSVNITALSPSITLYAHSNNKEIHCWTPNTTVTIKAAIHLGADNIITNNVPLTKLLIVSEHS